MTRYQTITQRIEALTSVLDPRFIDKDIQKRQLSLNKELNELLTEKEEWDNAFSQINKIKVSYEIGTTLDKLKRGQWNDQFNIIAQSKGYSGNGIRCSNIWNNEYKLLNDIEPLLFAKF